MHKYLATALLAFAGPVLAAPVTYKIDPDHTNVLASWSHFGFSRPSVNFGKADGTIVYDPDDVTASRVEVTLPFTGLNALAAELYDHLSGAEWFNAAKYPASTFKSTAVEAAGESKLKVSGELTVKGITKPVVLDATLNKIGEQPMHKRAAIGFDATASVKRSDFGMAKFVPSVSDEVLLRITTEAVVPKARK